MSSRVLPQFDLLQPRNVADVVALLSQHEDQVSILSGGTDLLVWAYIEKNKTPYVLSLSAIEGLDNLDYVPGEGLRIGAKVKVAQLLKHPAVAKHYPALYQAAVNFATPQIRNMATVVGNVLRASPAGDCACAILALGGQVVLQGSAGQRMVDIDDFWVSYGVTGRKPDEFAVELRIADTSSSTCSAFERMTRVHEDLSKLNVAIRLEMEQGTCKQARISMGCVGPTPLRLKKTERLLSGAKITAELLQQVAASASAEVTPIDDQRSTAEYRRQVSGVILRRVIEQTVAKS